MSAIGHLGLKFRQGLDVAKAPIAKAIAAAASKKRRLYDAYYFCAVFGNFFVARQARLAILSP
jgi:hypothetical protein